MTKIIMVEYQSVWGEGIVSSTAKLNLDTGEIFDVGISGDGEEFEDYISEGIIYDDEYYQLEYDCSYLADNVFSEFKMNNPILCAKYNLTLS